jgi:hypothetical protein
MVWSTGEREAVGQRSAPPDLPPPDLPPPSARGSDALRASDAEREGVLGELRDGFARGRLSHETFVTRVEAALGARRRGELENQVADLRAPRRPRPPLTRALSAGVPSTQAPRARARGLGAAVREAAAGRRRPPAPSALVLPAEPRQRFTIGRESSCDLSLGDLTVSRLHAELCRDTGGWRLADLGSMNGTRLNGWRILGPVPVSPGDLVTFGVVTFVLVSAPGASG